MLKSFDFFRKIQTDQELTSSTGGVFTLISLIAAGLLILMSLQDFYQQKYYTFLAVKNDDSQYLPMRIDIVFNKLPCEVLQIEFNDELEYVESNLQNKLTLENVPSNSDQGQIYQRDISNIDKQKQQLRKHLQQGYQCKVKGTLPLPKTPGKLIFKSTAQNNLLMNMDNPLIEKVRMSYRIQTLQFGSGNNTFQFPIAHKSKNIQNYLKQLDGDFKTRQFIQNFHSQTRKLDFFNHIKIIPVVIDGEKKTKGAGQKYRYSLRAGSAESEDIDQKLFFMTEIQPINIVYKKKSASFYDLLIQLLAIVGGTVSTLGIVNSLSHYLFNLKK